MTLKSSKSLWMNILDKSSILYNAHKAFSLPNCTLLLKWNLVSFARCLAIFVWNLTDFGWNLSYIAWKLTHFYLKFDSFYLIMLPEIGLILPEIGLFIAWNLTLKSNRSIRMNILDKSSKLYNAHKAFSQLNWTLLLKWNLVSFARHLAYLFCLKFDLFYLKFDSFYLKFDLFRMKFDLFYPNWELCIECLFEHFFNGFARLREQFRNVALFSKQ